MSNGDSTQLVLFEVEEFPELSLVRELTILINTHRGSAVVDNLAAALRRILKEERS